MPVASRPTSPAVRARAAEPPRVAAEDEVPWHNEIVLCGRLTARPEPVELPSGDPLWRFRVTVERRPPARSPGGRRAAERPSRRVVDAIDCVTTQRRVAKRLEKVPLAAVVTVGGTLTRRFWRSPGGGPASRYEVVVESARVGPPDIAP